MCKSRNSAKTLIVNKGKIRTIKIDRCLSNIIAILNAKGYKTLGCCCGHLKYNMSIIIEGKDKNEKTYAYDLITCIDIPRKKRFYVKDKQGYYYIPECIGGKKWKLKH